MTVTAVLDLGQRLERARSRRFVGRTAELELFAARLEAAAAGDTAWDLFSVLWVHGPGGIGKSTLLSACAEAARKAGFTVLHIDCGRIRPTPAGIRAAVPDSLGNRTVVMIDAAERLEAAEDWLREEFLPTLPAGTLVVIAGRRPPGERWRSDPGWRDLLRVVSLRNLLPEAVRALLEVEQISGALLEQVMALTHGHPLALSLLIDAIRRCDTGGEVPATLGELPDLVAALLRRLVDQAPTGRHRAALQVSAHAPITTEPVLRAVLADSDAREVSELWDWLRDLTIMEDSQAGIRPHEVARDILEADLRWRDPDAYADIHRRVRGHAVDQLKASAGNPETLQHAVADLLFLVRDHPVAGVGWDWDAFGEPPGECVQSEQMDLIIAMTRAVQGARQAELVDHWLRRQPEAFRLFRDSGGEVAGFVARLSLHLALPEEIEADPGTAALWRYAQQHHPPRPGEQVVAWRFLVDRDPDETHPRLSGTLFGAWHISDILLRPPTAWDFIANYADLDHWQAFFNHWDFVHLPEADYQIGSTRYVTFAHDWRRVGVAEWLERTAARELGEPVTQLVEPAAALSQEEFAAAVKQALRSLHQPQALSRNPLLAASMVQTEMQQRPDGRPDQILRGLILQAAQVLKSDPRAEAYYRVLDRTYLRPAPTQEKAAELLDLPFSTYRRYRDRGLEAITDWLWDRDIDRTAGLG
jgi:AAA ATPase domain